MRQIKKQKGYIEVDHSSLSSEEKILQEFLCYQDMQSRYPQTKVDLTTLNMDNIFANVLPNELFYKEKNMNFKKFMNFSMAAKIMFAISWFIMLAFTMVLFIKCPNSLYNTPNKADADFKSGRFEKVREPTFGF